MRRQRKVEHINCSLSLFKKKLDPSFADVQFIPAELPQQDLTSVDLATVVFGNTQWPSFLYLNAMTGGSAETALWLKQITQIAKLKKLPLAVGSQSLMIDDSTARDYFKQVRVDFPDGFIMANTSAAVTVDIVKRFIDTLEANALQIHLNLAQEALMSEGDRNFCGYLENLAAYAETLAVPLILKAVGYGISRETYYKVADLGIAGIDISGNSGLNFVDVEIERMQKPKFSDLKNWGLTTFESLLDLLEVVEEVEVWASGGIYDAFSAVKCLALGAKAVGMASPILYNLATQGSEETLQYLDCFFATVKTIMRMLGVKNLAQLRKCPLLLRGTTKEFCELRGINYKKYARRNG